MFCKISPRLCAFVCLCALAATVAGAGGAILRWGGAELAFLAGAAALVMLVAARFNGALAFDAAPAVVTDAVWSWLNILALPPLVVFGVAQTRRIVRDYGSAPRPLRRAEPDPCCAACA